MIRRARESIIFQPVREGFPSEYAFRARFSRLLTLRPGRRYSPAMGRRVNSGPRTGIQFARKKQFLIFHSKCLTLLINQIYHK